MTDTNNQIKNAYLCTAKTSRMRLRTTFILLAVISLTAVCPRANAFSLALDSVAEWGKFPKFCVNTYRWGDKFFNSYDSTYVKGTGYKFNVKAKSEFWLDNYVFQLTDNYRMTMTSEMNMSGGFYLTYLAVSLGYDYNIGKIFNIGETTRRRFNFRLNCALLSADLYWVTNDVGTNITSHGHKGDRVSCNIPFAGINTSMFGVDTYYFFNNKRYSRAAAFNFSKIQLKSQGSWFLGLSYWTQTFTFDFNGLEDKIISSLPAEWAENGYIFNINNHNYAIRGGFGYNWVFARHWVLGVSESPVIGLKYGTVNGGHSKVSLSLFNRAQMSVVWNNRRWFAGIILSADNGFYFDRKQSLLNGIFNTEISAGYRFNLW